MPAKIGTREEWQAARAELSKLEAEYAELGQKITEQRRQLPWVPVEKEYEFVPARSDGPAGNTSSRGIRRTECRRR
jgi:predicted dithiol-disulfide oxidoreductase (DUF899 family)